MPPQQGVWLHDQECLLPGSNQPGQQDEEDAIGPGERWPFHPSFKDDELLAEEGIFCDQLGARVSEDGQGSTVWFTLPSRPGGRAG